MSKFLTINLTNAVPQRVLLLSEIMAEFGGVRHLCLKRHAQSNVEGALELEASSTLNYLGRVWDLLRRERPELLLFDDLRVLPYAVAFRARYGGRLIYNRQEVPSATAADEISQRTLVPFPAVFAAVEWAESSLARRCDGMLCVPLQEQYRVRVEKWHQRMLFVPNVPHAPTQLRAAATTNGTFRLAYTGAISRKNGLTQYLRLTQELVAKSNRDVALLLIGHLDGLTREDVLDLARHHDVAERVVLHEWMPYDELGRMLQSVHVGLDLLDPNDRKYRLLGEGASRKVFTYMAAGVPVIANRPFADTVERSECGQSVAYDDQRGLFTAAHRLLTDPAWWKHCSTNGQQAVCNQYCWEKEGDRVRHFLRSLLWGSRSGS